MGTLRTIFAGIVLLLGSTTVLAQTAQVRANVNLRPTPSSSEPAIRLLRPPEVVTLLGLRSTNGYFQVETELDEQGWVFGSRIDIAGANLGIEVTRNVNLRPTPSTSQDPIRKLLPPERAKLESVRAQNRYYQIRTDSNEVGWVWNSNVRIVNLDDAIPMPDELDYPDARGTSPDGWAGNVFRLSQNYPRALPAAGSQPWKNFDFRTQPTQYLRAVLDYSLAGNINVDFNVQNNSVRKWYHTPWLHSGPNGREFIRGLTMERTSRERELHPNQGTRFRNYAVGFYNPRGGFTLRRIWGDPDQPNPEAASFPEGTVTFKLLFTTATVNEVPYLENAFEWQANIAFPSNPRTPQTVRLLQIDVAVKDSRADSTTGWVFGTFVYDNDANGDTPFERMVPLGLMWGNDPTLKDADFDSGERPQESMILNPVIGGVTQHLGFNGRLNGPVDNPRSSCLSCHSTAQVPRARVLPRTSAPESERLRWFRNLPSGTPFDPGETSLDYSLQVSEGLFRYFQSRGAPRRQ